MPLFEFADDAEFYSLKQTAQVLGVSEATVRNWMRSNIVNFQKHERALVFPKKEIDELNFRIRDGTVERLKSRANKNTKRTTRQHNELGDKDFIERVRQLTRLTYAENHTAQKTLCALALSFAIDSGSTKLKELVEREIAEWDCTVAFVSSESTLPTGIPDYSVALSIAYQHLKSDGDKAIKGAIYTPPEIADEVCQSFIHERMTFIDPCCGSGIFLVAAIRRLKYLGVENWFDYITGCDIDEDAVLCARFSCLFEIGEEQEVVHSNLKIFKDDALVSRQLETLYGSFDIVATNPPWGATYEFEEAKVYRDRFTNISSGEIFSFFTELAFKLLREEGQYSFILPESILSTSYHRDIRSVLLAKKSLQITDLKRAFHGVLTNVVRVDAKNSVGQDDFLTIYREGIMDTLPLNSINSETDFIVSLHSTSNKIETIRKIEDRNNFTLKDNAIWALGIVTGNNSEYVKGASAEGLEPLYKGKDILPYRLGCPSSFITFDKSRFQQCADERIYRAPEKLIYKFISKDLCFSFDSSGALTLNSANIVIPKTGKSIYYVMAALNSSYANFYFKAKFNSIKVLRRQIENIPIPILPSYETEVIEEYARMAVLAEDASVYRQSIDRIFNAYYDISEDELRL